MALYDGLPLNTPTLMYEDDNIQTWATRTTNGGTVENRVKAGSDVDRAQQLAAQLENALSGNSTFLAIPNASVTQLQVLQQVKALTRQVQALLRFRCGKFESLD